MKRFQKLAVTTAVSTTLLIAWGGLVRATGSGDGCPDWPTCFGRWIPRLEYHTIIEYIHRLLGVVSGLLALAMAIWALWSLLRRTTDRTLPRSLAWPAVLLAPLFAVQGAVGAVVVRSGLNPLSVSAHFALAMLVIGLLVGIVVQSFAVDRLDRPRGDRGLFRLTAITAGTTYALLLVGTYVRAESAGLAFRDWPLMDGRLVPLLGARGAPEMFAHRLLAAAAGLLVLWVAIRVRAMRPRSPILVRLATLLLALFAGQVVVGALNVWTGLGTAPRAAHVAMSALIWATAVALALSARWIGTAPEVAAHASERAEHPAEPASARDTITAYFRLTKPRIIVLLLITTVPAMMLAARGMPPIALIMATLLGGAIAAGSANAINCYLDRDIDEIMKRTRGRPLPAGQVEPEHALRFGYVLGALSFVFLSITVNVLAALLALSAIAFYVFVYTMWLKRSTTQNIVIGGAAGAVPALVGWAAVTGTLAAPAWILFAIVFVWTPPHFWALAMRYSGDYAAAGVPMLPAVRGDAETRKQILLYSLVLFAASLVLVPLGHMGVVYVSAAVVLGAVFCYRALQLYRGSTPALAMSLFKYSILYLALLFAAVAVDSFSLFGPAAPI